MGVARLGLILALAACGRPPAAGEAVPVPDLRQRVVSEFEEAVLDSKEAYLALFDFVSVGKFEKLLHRYDVLGRAELAPETRAAWAAETPEPLPPDRERRNVGNFYPGFVRRTVGRGGCRAVEPVDEYARLLGQPFAPLPAEHRSYEPLRQEVNAFLAHGGIVGVKCAKGHGGIALVFTHADDTRGYRLITMYDDRGLGD